MTDRGDNIQAAELCLPSTDLAADLAFYTETHRFVIATGIVAEGLCREILEIHSPNTKPPCQVLWDELPSTLRRTTLSQPPSGSSRRVPPPVW